MVAHRTISCLIRSPGIQATVKVQTSLGILLKAITDHQALPGHVSMLREVKVVGGQRKVASARSGNARSAMVRLSTKRSRLGNRGVAAVTGPTPTKLLFPSAGTDRDDLRGVEWCADRRQLPGLRLRSSCASHQPADGTVSYHKRSRKYHFLTLSPVFPCGTMAAQASSRVPSTLKYPSEMKPCPRA